MSYPPLASAGEDQVIKLPNDEVTLDGSGSTAFKVGTSLRGDGGEGGRKGGRCVVEEDNIIIFPC